MSAKLAIPSSEMSAMPIHNVPVEIIQEILVHAIPTIQHSAGLVQPVLNPNEPHPHAVRATLLRVCSTWRRLVLNTPRIWSTIIFDGRLPRDVEVVAQWLRLSKACPLDVYISLEKWFPIPKDAVVYRYTQSILGNPRDLEKVYMMLSGHLERVRVLVADLRHCRTACFPSLGLLFPSEHCTKAKRLEVLACVGTTVGRMGRIHAPRLRSMTLGYTLNNLLDQFTQDTVLAVRELCMTYCNDPSPSQMEAVGLYQRLERLQLIDIRVAGGPHDDDEPDAKVLLPSLRFLEISALRSEMVVPFVKALEAPRTESVSFEGCGGSAVKFSSQEWSPSPVPVERRSSRSIMDEDSQH